MPDSTSAKIGEFFKKHKAASWGIIIVGGVAAVVIYRRKAAQAQTATPASASGGSTDSAGNTGAIDPQTGFVYGSAEDQQALQQAQSSIGQGFDPFLGSGFDPFLGSGTGGGGGSTGGGGGSSASISSNDQWLMAAEKTLPNGHSAAVETALSRVLGGLTVTWAQRALFLEAKGVLGEPPGGYPKPIKVENAGGQHHGSHQKVRVPDVIGESHAMAVATLKTAGLKVMSEGSGEIESQRPSAGQEVRRGSIVTLVGRVHR